MPAPRKPIDQKHVHSPSTRKLVRDLLAGAASASETAKIPVSQSRPELDLDSWPTADRIRQSF